MDNRTDIILWKKIKDGDRNSFRQLFHIYYQPLLLFSFKFTDTEMAKDLVQECFFDLWQNRKKIEITTSFSAWFFKVVKNRCYKYLREEQRKNDMQNNVGLKLKEEELQFFTYSEKSILEFDVKDRVEKVMNQLPDKCGQVFRESRLRGLSNKEIAAKYHISLKAVEKHISKALKLFREEFQDLLTVFIAILFQFFF